MKKWKSISILTSLALTSFFGACSLFQPEKIDNKNKYEWAYAPSMADECDADMKIDGILDEDRWGTQKQLVHTEKGVKTTYTTIFTEKGLYVGAKAEDEEIGYTGRLRYEDNSCFWFSIKGADINTNFMKGTEVFNFYVDSETASSFNHARYNAKGKVDKSYEENPTVLTAELFVTWDALNIELGENGELPEFVWINPHYRYIGGTDRDTWLNPLLFFDNNDRQQCSGRFSSVGYINADKENAVLGNAVNGYSKSDGWDLSEIDNGIVKSDVDHAQGIFFTNVCSNAYTYTVTVDVKDEAVNGKMGQVGVFDAIDEISFNAFFLNQPSILKKDSSKYSTLSLYGTGFGGWSWIDKGMILPAYNENDHKITYTVIKDGGYFYYIVNDMFVASEYVEYLSEESCPGLFALDCVAEFSDYSATDLSENPERVDELLAEYDVYRVKIPEKISGGGIELVKNAVVSGENAVMTITPTNGFILTDLTINGEDKYAEVVSKIEKGKFVLENITETVEIVPTFTRIPETVSVTGKILIAGTEKPVLNATATLWGKHPLLYYSTATTSNGTYNFRLPVTDQTIDGKEFTFDGAYSFKAKAGGYLSVNDEFTLSNETRSKNYYMSAPVYDEKTWYVVGEEGVYTPSGSNYYTSSYAYTSNQASETVVYSVKISAPMGIVGYRGQLPNVGITITDGTKITDAWTNQNVSYTIPNEYFATRVGLANCGVVSHMGSIAALARRIDRPVGDRWNFSTVNDDSAFSSSTTERTLTVAIFENNLYVYVDGVYITDVSLLNENYFTYNGLKFSANSKYRLGVNTTNIDHVTNPVSFEVLVEEYGDSAFELLQTEDIFDEVRTAITPLENRNMKVDNGVYSITPTAHGLPWGYGGEAYYYTSEASNVAVYSVKATLTKDLVGYTNPSDGNSANFVGYSNIGIYISDGNMYNGSFGVAKRTANYIHIGMSELGLVGNTMGEMRRRLDVDFESRYTLNASANTTCGFTAGITERTLTLALYKGVIYIYVDGQYVVKYSLANSDYFATSHFKFDANSQLKFGVGTEWVDASVTPVEFTVEKQLIGNEALAEIDKNFAEINIQYSYSISCDGTTTSNFRKTTASNAVVFGIDVDTVNGIPTPYCNDNGHVGIAISTSANASDVMTIGFSQLGISSACNQGMVRSWDTNFDDRWNSDNSVNTTYAFAGWANKGGNLKSGKLTIVIYKDTVYIYAGATTESFVNSGSLVVNGGYVNLNSFTAGSQWTVGVGASLVYNQNGTIGGNALDCSAWEITVTERVSLYGDKALEYIKANYSANITVE